MPVGAGTPVANAETVAVNVNDWPYTAFGLSMVTTVIVDASTTCVVASAAVLAASRLPTSSVAML